MIGAILDGIKSYQYAIGMITRYRLWKYVIVSSLLSFAVIAFLVAGPTWAFMNSGLEERILDAYPFEFGKHVVEWLVENLLTILMIFIMFFFLGKYIVMIVLSPFMSILSEKVESAIKGTPVKSDGNFITDLIRGLRIALRNIIRELLLTLVVIVLFNLLPVIGTIASTVVIFLIQSYYAGFGNMDYTLERKQFNVRESVKFVRRNWSLAIGNGMFFLLLFVVPVIGWVLAPVYGTISAALLVLTQTDNIPLASHAKKS
ncbi:MAG: EI24 domain-containing protein [Bacteroidota bacterium]